MNEPRFLIYKSRKRSVWGVVELIRKGSHSLVYIHHKRREELPDDPTLIIKSTFHKRKGSTDERGDRKRAMVAFARRLMEKGLEAKVAAKVTEQFMLEEFGQDILALYPKLYDTILSGIRHGVDKKGPARWRR